jgi:peptide/nickel transport system substrate-binding protein
MRLKKLIIPLFIILVCAFIITGCEGAATATTPVADLPVVSITPSITQTASTGQPIYGGIFNIVTAAGPQVLSYVPEMEPGDHYAVFPAVERLVDANTDRAKGLDGVLAESWQEDPVSLTITLHIRKGVKFSDGSDLNADVVNWNFKMLMDAKSLPYLDKLKSIKVTDPYTLVINLNQWTNQLLPTWGWWVAIVSKNSFDTQASGDLAKYKDWARTHVVGTGPFALKEYKRDDHITWIKNPNYWRTGRPYLDGINVRFIPDSVAASTIFQTKQADQWSTPAPKEQVTLLSRGFKAQSSWSGFGYVIVPNTVDPKSKWNDLRLRQAVAYALDTPKITRAIGSGIYKPLTYLPPEGEWGYDPDYPALTYNPSKAKQLLIDAGYPNGLQISLMVGNDPVSVDIGTAIKQYLDAVGFQTKLDITDPDHYFGSIYGTAPYPDLGFLSTSEDTNYLSTYMRWFSSMPITNLAALGRPDEQKAMDQQVSNLSDPAQQRAMTARIMKLMNDNVRVIPVYFVPAAVLIQPWVNSTEFTQGFVRWQMEEVWMDKH